jgi:hypothetical protein
MSLAKNMRSWAIGTALVTLGGLVCLAGYSYAGAGSKLTPDIRKIAKAIKDGDKAAAEALATKLAKNIEEVDDLMHTLKPREKGGIGVGMVATKKSDGIEVRLRDIARDAPSNMAKDAAALEQMGYDTAAVALVAKAKAPARDMGKKKVSDWKRWSDEMYADSVALAKAAEGKGAQNVKTAATKVNQTCTACHSVFRE